MRISDWSSDVCSSDLGGRAHRRTGNGGFRDGPYRADRRLIAAREDEKKKRFTRGRGDALILPHPIVLPRKRESRAATTMLEEECFAQRRGDAEVCRAWRRHPRQRQVTSRQTRNSRPR